MRWTDYIDAAEVRNAIATLQQPGKVFEIRIIDANAKKKNAAIISGYFRDAETVLKKLDTVDVRGKNIYITLGEVKDECFARSQSERFEQVATATSDTEIVRYRWLFVDTDPVRLAGTSSTDAEMKLAAELSKKILAYMHGIGFADPVKAASGNGYHLLYRIDMPNDEKSRKLVDRCLKNLAAMFDTDAVKVDTTNSNPARICKLHGTLAQKGRSTKDRPHRMSRIISVPETITISPMGAIEALAGELPEEPVQSRKRQTVQQEFDLVGFLADNGLTYTVDSNDRSTIYKLDHCPFDHNHTNGDAKIFQYADGAIAFKCHHNSCRQYRWQDVRLKFEPEAYDAEDDFDRIEAGYLAYLKRRPELRRQQERPKPKKREFRKLTTAASLLDKVIPEPVVYLGVGDELPLLTEGTCILSAKPKLGKSWLALSLCLALASGGDFLNRKTRQCSVLYFDLETGESLQQKRLRKALHGMKVPPNLYIESKASRIDDGFLEQLDNYMEQDPKIGFVVVDVFQLIRSAAKSIRESEYEHAYRDISPLNDAAAKYHICIILVCHDRKMIDADDPFNNILGSTGLQGAATQMMVMFRRRAGDPIHISIKSKTVDGLPELDTKLDDAQWTVVDGVKPADRERAEKEQEYMMSDIRQAVIRIVEKYDSWKGRCSGLINLAIDCGFPLTAEPKEVGSFLHKHRALFLKNDEIMIEIINNGGASKIYKIQKSTIHTIHGEEEEPFIEWQNAEESSIPWE